MWNRRIMIFFIIAVVLIVLVIKILMNFLYDGFILKILFAGAKGKVCYYTVQIDPNLDVNNFVENTPKMGIALDWADITNAVVKYLRGIARNQRIHCV